MVASYVPRYGGARPKLEVKPATRPGPKRKEGERYPSGKLKDKVAPNPIVLAQRLAICADHTKAASPLSAAHARGWLSDVEHLGAQFFISFHRAAGLGGPTGYTRAKEPQIGSGAANDLNFRWHEMTDAEVRAFDWKRFSDKELARIWDSALPVHSMSESGSKTANRRWRELCAAMTPEQRGLVTSICILEHWPRWLMARIDGDMRTGAREYNALREGLRAVREAMRTPVQPDPVLMPENRPQEANDNLQAANDQPRPKVRMPSLLAQPKGKPEHLVDLAFTDADTGEVLRTVRVERVRRWSQRNG